MPPSRPKAQSGLGSPCRPPGPGDGVPMESVRKLTSSRMSRVGWALAIVALAGAMALSFVFAYSSVGDQQRAAQAAAVVEVDQRYAAIEAAAYQLWRPIQLVIGVLILIALLMLVASVLSWRGRRFAVSSKDGARPAPGFAQGGSTRAQKDLEKRLEAVEESLRTAEQRAGASEREKRQIAERLVTAQEQLELMTAAAKSPKPAKGSDEAVSRRLAELEAERDRMTAEVTRLERELQERGSAPAGENGPSPSSAETGVQERVAELEAALADANAKAASFESAARQLEEERKVASAELDRAKEEIAGQKGRKGSKSKDTGSHAEAAEQMAKAEERAQQAEGRAQQAEGRAQQAEGRAKQVE